MGAEPSSYGRAFRLCPSQSSGQGAPHVTASPLGQTTGAPAAHEGMSQFSVPAVPGGQATTHAEPASHVVWQGPLWQMKWQTLFGPHVHWPSAQTPSQAAFDPAQETWHGGEPQTKEHVAPSSQVHVPLAQAAEQKDEAPHST